MVSVITLGNCDLVSRWEVFIKEVRPTLAPGTTRCFDTQCTQQGNASILFTVQKLLK